MTVKKDCALGYENKARLNVLYQVVDAHKADLRCLIEANKVDFKEDIADMKKSISDMAATASRIFLAVFISTITTLVNVIFMLWVK